MKIRVLFDLDKIDREILKEFIGKKDVKFADYRRAIEELVRDKMYEIMRNRHNSDHM